MDKEIRKRLAIFSIIVAVAVILILLMSGFELSGFEIGKVVKIN